MELTLLNFSKRMNSTKQPTESDLAAGKKKTIYLKDITNIDNPEIRLSGATDADYAYTYAYIKEWGRFYHIKTADLRHDDIFKISCELDDLATYKTQILNTSAYIAYASTGFNRWIRDDRYPILAKGCEYVTNSANFLVNDTQLFQADDNETIILTCMSKWDYYAKGGLIHWIMTEQQLAEIMGTMFDSSSFWDDWVKQFGDMMGAIVSVIRLPINSACLPKVGTSSLYIADYQPADANDDPYFLYQLEGTHIHATATVNRPALYTDFREAEPYCNYRISLPFVGITDISIPEFLNEDGDISVRLDLDLITGNIIYTLMNNGLSRPVATFSGQCGSQIPIVSSQIANTSNIVTGVASSGIGLLASVLSANPAPALVGSITGLASAFYNSNQRTNSVIGSYSGGRGEFANRQLRIIGTKYKTANEPSNLTDFEGRPVCKVDLLSNYSGFVKTQGFSIDLAVNSNVIKSINSKLDAGIYIE